MWAGYVVGALVLARIVWGFMGPVPRGSEAFVTDPTTAIRYLGQLFVAHAKRYIGHCPAGGAMVVALWTFLAATVATGLVRYAEEKGAGPWRCSMARHPLSRRRRRSGTMKVCVGRPGGSHCASFGAISVKP